MSSSSPSISSITEFKSNSKTLDPTAYSTSAAVGGSFVGIISKFICAGSESEFPSLTI